MTHAYRPDTVTVRRLLAISWEMPPLSGPRAVQVTRTLIALAALGWESRTVCFGPTSGRYHEDFHVDLEAASHGLARRAPVPSPEEWLFFRALWRVCPPLKQLPDEKWVWRPAAIAEARRQIADARPDVIVSFAQPWTDHLVGRQLARETGIPWVAHFSDPWVDSPYQQGAAWQRRLWSRMERAVAEEATRLVFVNAYARDRVMAKYPALWSSRTAIVAQGWEAGTAPLPAPAGSSPRPLRIAYTGRFYDGLRTPAVFLTGLAQLHHSTPLHGRLEVEFIGHGMAAYEALAERGGLAGIVRFTGRLDPHVTRVRAAQADVLLTIDAPSNGASLFLPSKLVDYLPFERPLLALTPSRGPSAELVRELGYAAVDPDDVTGVADAVRMLVDAHEAGRLAASLAHRAIAGRYDIRETTKAFARVLDEAVGSS